MKNAHHFLPLLAIAGVVAFAACGSPAAAVDEGDTAAESDVADDAAGTDAADVAGTDAQDARDGDSAGSDAVEVSPDADAVGTDAVETDAAGTDVADDADAATDALADAETDVALDAATDAEGTDAAGTDAVGTDAQGTDAEGTDAAGTDAEGTDAAGTDAEGSDAVGADADDAADVPVGVACTTTCDDSDVCTKDSCDTSVGLCVHETISCSDNDPCTADSCGVSGCVNVAKVCNDANACTSDSCVGGGCVFSTNDSLDPGLGACMLSDTCGMGAFKCVSGSSVCVWQGKDPAKDTQDCAFEGACKDGVCYVPTDPTATAMVDKALIQPDAKVVLTLTVSDVNTWNDKNLDDIASVTWEGQIFAWSTPVEMAKVGMGPDVHTATYVATVDSTNQFLQTGTQQLIWRVTDKSGRKIHGVVVLYVYTGKEVLAGPTQAHTTIQAGIDAAANGDVVHVDAGMYSGEGNVQLHVDGKKVLVVGHGTDTVVQCQGAAHAIEIVEDAGEPTFARMAFVGCTSGAIHVTGTTATPLHVLESDFSGNTGGEGGSAILVQGPGGNVSGALLHIANNASASGGAVRVAEGTLVLSESTFVDNGGTTGAAHLIFDNAKQSAVADCTFSGGPAPAISMTGGGGSPSAFTKDKFIGSGGIVFDGATAYVSGSSFSGLSTTGISAIGDANVTVNSSTFTGNSGTCVDFSSNVKKCSIGNSKFSFNTGALLVATGSGGAGIDHCTFESNDGGSGSPVVLGSGAVLATSTFSGNKTSGNGGAVSLSGTSTVTDCLLESNTAGGNGGAIFISGPGASVRNCEFQYNQAVNGAAIAASFPATADKASALVNLYVHDNFASGSGGGLYLDVSGVSDSAPNGVTLRLATFYGNKADVAGGHIFSHASAIVIDYSILYFGTSPSGGSIAVEDNSSQSFSITSSDVDLTSNFASAVGIVDPGNHINGTGFGSGAGTFNISANPKLTFIGGARLSALLSGQSGDSPAIDAGGPLSANDIGYGGWSTRSDGVPDVGGLDMGFHYASAASCAPGNLCPGDGSACISVTCENDLCGTKVTQVHKPCAGSPGVCSADAICVGCVDNSDCTSNFCSNSVCVTPKCDDKTMNGTETDVDCGGSCGATCALSSKCKVDGDCAGGACASGVCATLVQVGSGGAKFSPKDITIPVGSTVKWVWLASFHSVVSGNGSSGTADGKFCSPSDTNCSSAPLSNKGVTYVHTFGSTGTFGYFCGAHFGMGMTGSVTVQ